MEIQSALEGVKTRLSGLKRGHWLAIGGGAAVLLLVAGSGNGGVSVSNPYSCEDIISEVKELSEEQGPEVFEINISQRGKEWTEASPTVSCWGHAETSAGSQYVEFGTTISNQGNVMVNLSYPNGIM